MPQRKPAKNPFQKWLRRWLREVSISNKEACELFSWNNSDLNRYLRGVLSPSYRTLLKIKGTIDVDMNDLFEEGE